MKKNIVKLSILAATVISVPAFAAGDVGSGPNPYSECGIGAAIFNETGWAAATSNVIWDLGSTAVTSATVSPETCSKKSVKAAMFIRDTYAQIAEDAARGTGEHLATALEIFECGASGQNAAMGEVRDGMSKAVANPTFNDQEHLKKSGQLFNIINSAARNNCTA